MRQFFRCLSFFRGQFKRLGGDISMIRGVSACNYDKPISLHSVTSFGKRNLLGFANKSFRSVCVSSPIHVQSGSSVSSLPGLYQPRYIYVYTCVGKWEDVPNGFVFDVGYVDSHNGTEEDDQKPVIVALHGILGCHEDLFPVLEPLVKLGYRVIAPNFPGNRFTSGISSAHDDVFFHTTDERAELVGDFLLNLGIERVDAVVGVNEGCYPAVRLSTMRPEMFSSLVLICPGGHRVYKGLPKLDSLKTVSKLWDTPFLRPLLRPFIKLGAIAMGYGHLPFTSVIPAIRTATNIGFGEFGSFLVTLDEMHHPCCMMYSADDEKVEADISEEFADLLGIATSAFTVYNKEGKIVRKGDAEAFSRGIMFEEGGHYPYERHCDIIVYSIRDIVKFARSTAHTSVKGQIHNLSRQKS